MGKMDGYKYEQFVAKYLRHSGYSGVNVTQKSGDFGVDILAKKYGTKYAIQCKYYTRPVGISAVQQVAAGMKYYGCQKGMVVTNSTYTEAAKKLASSNGVKLLSHVTPGKLGLNKFVKWILTPFYLYVGIGFILATFETIKDSPDRITILASAILDLFYFYPLIRWAISRRQRCLEKKRFKKKQYADSRFIENCLKSSYPYFAKAYSAHLVEFETFSPGTLEYVSNSYLNWTEARNIINILVDNGLAKSTETMHRYIWTAKAKSIKSEGFWRWLFIKCQ